MTASEGQHRLSINIHQEAADFIDNYRESRGISVTETVRRALAMLKFVEETRLAGYEIATLDHHGQPYREWIVE